MSSRLNVCVRVCHGLLGLGPAALILRLTCPSGYATAGLRGVVLGLCSSSLHWMTRFCSLKWVSGDGGGQGMTSSCSLSSPDQEIRAHHTLQKALPEKQSPLLCPQLLPDPCLHLPALKLST